MQDMTWPQQQAHFRKDPSVSIYRRERAVQPEEPASTGNATTEHRLSRLLSRRLSRVTQDPKHTIKQTLIPKWERDTSFKF